MNFLVYTVLVSISDAMAALPIVPLAMASIVALIVNYLGSKRFRVSPAVGGRFRASIVRRDRGGWRHAIRFDGQQGISV